MLRGGGGGSSTSVVGLSTAFGAGRLSSLLKGLPHYDLQLEHLRVVSRREANLPGTNPRETSQPILWAVDFDPDEVQETCQSDT